MAEQPTRAAILATASCLTLALIACATGGSTSPAPPREWFSQIGLEPTTGRVGYHLTIVPSTYSSDQPGCVRWSKHRVSLQGNLPTGLTMSEGGWITGTPRQPGTWRFQMTLHGVHCIEGPYAYQDWGDRTINATIVIEP